MRTRKGQPVTSEESITELGLSGLGWAAGAAGRQIHRAEKVVLPLPDNHGVLRTFLQVYLHTCSVCGRGLCPTRQQFLPSALKDKDHTSTVYSLSAHSTGSVQEALRRTGRAWSVFCSNKLLSQEAHYCLITRRQLLNITIIKHCKLTCFTSAANFRLLQVNYSPRPGMANTHLCCGCFSFIRP